MADSSPSNGRNIPLVWIDPPDERVQWVNQFVSVAQPDEFVISLGQLSPPPIFGETIEQRQAQLDQISYIPVQTIAKFALNRPRLVELIEVLSKSLQQHDDVETT